VGARGEKKKGKFSGARAFLREKVIRKKEAGVRGKRRFRRLLDEQKKVNNQEGFILQGWGGGKTRAIGAVNSL